MKMLKHMEAVFIVGLGLVFSANYLLSRAPDARAETEPTSASIATHGKMAIVKVTAKRMSRIEKLQSLREERKLAALNAHAGNRL